MAKLECEFFPETAAVWRCESCATQYGEKCIPAGHSAHWGPRPPRCIRCEGNLQFLGSATDAKPFWQMLPHFFAYPLHLNSLIVIGLVAALSLLFGMNLLTVFLALLAAAIVIKYGFAIIEERGRGSAAPPQLSAVITGDEHHLFLRQIALFFCMGLAVGVAGYLNELLGVAVAGFITLATPASIIVLAVEKSVRRALDPRTLMSMMTAIGWPYLLLWVCTQIISAGPVYFLEWLALALPVSVVLPVIIATTVYFTFVLYAMLGYVLFEYQSELGFESLTGDDQEMSVQEFEKARALGESTVLIRDGELKRARMSLRRALDQVKDDIELHLRYHRLLMLLDDDESLANHCEYLVGLLKRMKALGRGVPVLLDVQKRLPAFQLKNTEAAIELARLLQMQGQHKAVVKLFHNLHKHRPKDPLVPEAYLLVATTLFEYFGEDAKALAIVKFVLSKYPEAVQREQFERLQAVLTQPPSTLSAG